MDPIGVWHGDHVRFSRLLDFLQREMTVFHGGEDPDYQLMRDAVHYLHFYADRVHHPREDVAFACLVRHLPTFQFTVDRLLQEHRAIAVAGESLLGLLEEILQDTIIARSTIESAAALYLVYFRNHLATEEREIMPRAAAVLTPEDWTAVAAAVNAVTDPMSGDDIVVEYRALRGWIARDTESNLSGGSSAPTR
jgi:hemerythrin-like domain-containing protein